MRAAFRALLLGHAAYALALIWRQSVVIDGRRYFVLFDDAMVSMCYARSLAEGAGLVWHAGAPRVEGITNLLWTLLMSLAHLLPLGEARVGLAVQLGSLALLSLGLVAVRALSAAVAPGRPATALLAVLLTACSLPLNAWSLVGTEVGLQALLVTVSACLALAALRGRDGAALLLAGVAGAAGLLRLDALVALAPALALVAWRAPRRGRFTAALAVALVLALGGATLFRLAYYGSWLPNTYPLKLDGIPRLVLLRAGAATLGELAVRLGLPIVLLALLPALRAGGGVARLLWGQIVAQLLYVLAIGGDAWEWWGADRFVTVIMPLLFVLLATGLADVVAWARRGLTPGRAHVVSVAGMAAGLVAAVQVNVIRLPATGPLREWAGIDRLINMEEHGEMVRLGLAARDATLPGARLAVAWAGTPIYFARRGGVDLLGKNDRTIATGPMRPTPFVPGHVKWDYHWSLVTLAPDAVLQLWESEPVAWQLLAARYRTVEPRTHGFTGSFWVRNDSPFVRPER